jgi:hypothetical protein
MTSVPARHPPQNHGDAAVAHTFSTESGAGSGSIAVHAILAANQADTNDATQFISASPAESGGGNDGHAVASLVQPPPPPPPLPPPLLPPLLLLVTNWFQMRQCFSKSSMSTRRRLHLMGAKQW